MLGKIKRRSRLELARCGGDILSSAGMQREKQYMHHGSCNVYDHSVRVALLCVFLVLLLRLRVDRRALVRGALLHDYFLYDWHNAPRERGLHGITHARTALENAERDFALGDVERNMIRSHMFPLNFALPKYREIVLLCISDKLCALGETLRRR